MANKPRVFKPIEYDEMPGDMVTLAAYAKLETELRGIKALHASLIDQGRKVLNATSDIGMSHADFIEWAMERLGA